MRTVKMCLILFILAAAALAHDPAPITTVSIEDTSGTNAPVKLWGTADAYAESRDGAFLLSVEENNLYFQNVSGKTIKQATIEVLKTDVRGNVSGNVHTLTRADRPNSSIVSGFSSKVCAGVPTVSGRRRVHSLQAKMSEAEYYLGQYVNPTAKAKVVSVIFADGTTWKSESIFH